MDIRLIEPGEMEKAVYLSSQAFRQGERDTTPVENWLNDPNRHPSHSYGVFDEHGLQAKVVVLHYRQQFGPTTQIPMGGVAGVACLPASRGKGYAGSALFYSMERMRDEGEVVSTLFPFSWEFYRKLGWEWVGISRIYTMTSRALKADPETERVRAAKPTDREAIVGCYNRHAERYRGVMVRTVPHWNRILDDTEKEHTYTYLYPDSGEIEGYLTFRGGKREETRLREFVTLTPRAQRALLGLLRRHEMQIERFTWKAPSDDTLWSQIMHWDLSTRIEPVTMGRIIDVPRSLEYCRPPAAANGDVVVHIEDSFAPWNQGRWKINFESGKVTVERTQNDADIALDIQALSQAFYGLPTVDELRSADRLSVQSENGFARFKQLFDGPPMWMNDSF